MRESSNRSDVSLKKILVIINNGRHVRYSWNANTIFRLRVNGQNDEYSYASIGRHTIYKYAMVHTPLSSESNPNPDWLVGCLAWFDLFIGQLWLDFRFIVDSRPRQIFTCRPHLLTRERTSRKYPSPFSENFASINRLFAHFLASPASPFTAIPRRSFDHLLSLCFFDGICFDCLPPVAKKENCFVLPLRSIFIYFC